MADFKDLICRGRSIELSEREVKFGSVRTSKTKDLGVVPRPRNCMYRVNNFVIFQNHISEYI